MTKQMDTNAVKFETALGYHGVTYYAIENLNQENTQMLLDQGACVVKIIPVSEGDGVMSHVFKNGEMHAELSMGHLRLMENDPDGDPSQTRLAAMINCNHWKQILVFRAGLEFAAQVGEA